MTPDWAEEEAKKAIGYREGGKNKDFVQTYDVLTCLKEIATALRQARERALEEAINVAINVIPCESICHCASEVAGELTKLKDSRPHA